MALCDEELFPKRENKTKQNFQNVSLTTKLTWTWTSGCSGPFNGWLKKMSTLFLVCVVAYTGSAPRAAEDWIVTLAPNFYFIFFLNKGVLWFLHSFGLRISSHFWSDLNFVLSYIPRKRVKKRKVPACWFEGLAGFILQESIKKKKKQHVFLLYNCRTLLIKKEEAAAASLIDGIKWVGCGRGSSDQKQSQRLWLCLCGKLVKQRFKSSSLDWPPVPCAFLVLGHPSSERLPKQDTYNRTEDARRGKAPDQELCMEKEGFKPLFVFPSAFPYQRETITQDDVLFLCHYLPQN